MTHQNRLSMNAQEAGAFALSCLFRGLSTADALAELAVTTWPSSAGHRSHTPTVRRLAKPLLMNLDEQHEESRASQIARAADKARWIALSASAQAEIRAAAEAAPVTISNKAARDVAVRHGITVHTNSIDNLRSLIDPRNPWNV